MAKTPCTRSTEAHYGRVVGRVGGLAVALGIGVAIANNPGVASAEEGKPSDKVTTTSTESSTNDTNPVKSVVKQLHSRIEEARERAESTRETFKSRIQSRTPQRDTLESSNVQATQIVKGTA